MDAFGPYRMDRPEYQYGLAEFGQEAACPSGEMRFADKDSVSDPFGSPDPSAPNWAPTRYVPWTSFYAARGIWSHATPGVMATEGENDGASVYAHEFSHILGVLDNCNNAYAQPQIREYTGPWDMMSRGSFNGPGGNHHRFEVSPTLGATMGSHHMLRDKLRMWAREIPLGPGTGRSGLHGLLLTLTGGDKTPDCTAEQDWRCDGGGYENYTLEVVDRMGSDSFTPDHGVLIAKSRR